MGQGPGTKQRRLAGAELVEHAGGPAIELDELLLQSRHRGRSSRGVDLQAQAQEPEPQPLEYDELTDFMVGDKLGGTNVSADLVDELLVLRRQFLFGGGRGNLFHERRQGLRWPGQFFQFLVFHSEDVALFPVKGAKQVGRLLGAFGRGGSAHLQSALQQQPAASRPPVFIPCKLK